ncbi:CGNR zinc finger domain-containing protein [Mycolicibacterium pyrenivorans]|uniref:CGNR zinc finger domain-containing protein n=1 Tax=Mycolicibacterium pyrenivorans TaxID=187102 RepID=UPI0021F391B3|nr:CGNR zinc finger domain-containing protein [Mycolicibacterium pyrenivorans]MCV7154374.1 CGNR zinc finger domain-containing protein [Mycolicibacterium pyrenivorans]
MSRSWPATGRYRLRTAPAGLALVQDLLNTLAIGEYGPDLLTDGATASAWAVEAAAVWSEVSGLPTPAMVLTDRDAQRLRSLRDVLREMIVAQRPPTRAPLDAAADLELSDGGRVRLVPNGAGAQWLASAVWIEVLLGQQSSTWPRLKFCREPACGSAFYDHSRNNSGVWHDVKTCGNRANLRTSRARRRTAKP